MSGASVMGVIEPPHGLSFLSPWVLAGLILVPLAVAMYVAHDARRRRSRAAFVSAPLAPALTPNRSGARRHVGPVMYLLAFTVLLLAAARPQADATVKVEQASVMLVTDRSGSMASEDVPGGRMTAVESAADQFLRTVPTDVKTGLIAFNQVVQLLQSPTTDREAIRTEVAKLTPAGGTAAGDALAQALRVLRPSGQTGKPVPGAIILLTDGKSVRGQDPVTVAQAAGKAGVKIYTVALGTDSGTLVTRKKDGTTVTEQVPPDRATLEKIAQASGGEAFSAADAASLNRIYDQLGRQVATKVEKREVTTAFAGGSLLLLVLGAGASMALIGRLP